MKSWIQELAQAIPQARLLTAPEDLIPYSFDGTAALRSQPEAVLLPTEPGQIVTALLIARRNQVPIVTRGSGTGLSGGAIPIPGCLVLCLVQMDQILELDRANLTMLVEAGAITQKISEKALAAGLFYPPDPGSMKISTIGGNVAENSGGIRGLKYGVTRDYIMAVEVVLPDGEIAWFGSKCVKDVAGYSMKDLFIGSEGTLGIVTKVLLRLVPQPKTKRTLMAIFDRMTDAAETISAIIAHPIIPCTLEFLDKITIGCVESYSKIGLPLDAEAILIMETDGHPTVVEEESAIMAEIARKKGARLVRLATSEAEANQLIAARRIALSALARIAPTTILEDITVPRSKLPEMVAFIQEVGVKHGVKIGTFGHMGDGNLHPTFLTNERNPEEMHRVELAMQQIFACAVRLGGSITGEHGVGLAKKPYLEAAIGRSSLGLMRKLKQSLDPTNLLNPGKIFD